MGGPGQRRALLLLVAIVSVNASYTVLIPFVPDLEERVGAGASVIALAFALFAAAKAVTQPAGGWWVDRWRPGAVAFVALVVAAVGVAITALARDPLTLLAGRTCWGVGEGLVTPALYAGMAALCRHYGISTSRMMGNFGSAAVTGFMLGPLVAGVAAPLGLQTLFLAGAVATVVTAFGLLRAIPAGGLPAADPVLGNPVPGNPVPGNPVPGNPEPGNPVPGNPAAGGPEAGGPEAGDPEAGAAGAEAAGAEGVNAGSWWRWVIVLGALDLVTYLLYSALEPMLPLYLSAGAGAGSARGGISAVFVTGLATLGVSMWLLGRWTERLRLVPMIRIGLVCNALGLAGLAASPRVPSVAAWFVAFMVGHAMLYLAARRGIVELRSASAHQGKAFGLFGLVSDLGNVTGPLAGVALYEWTGRFSFILLGAAGAATGLLLTVLMARTARRAGPSILVPAAGPAPSPSTPLSDRPAPVQRRKAA